MNFKQPAFDTIDNSSRELIELALYLYNNPETAFKEFKAHDYLCDFLERKEFKVERNFIYDTGFRATYETNHSPHFVILVEYDALPEIGHACGHNIIAETSIAAAIGMKTAMDNGLKCKLSLFGTPAEEGGGGKLKFISEGLFRTVDLAMMSHPSKFNLLEPPSLAVIGLTISFVGKDAHASINPWDGVNALDAAVLAYQSVSCLRQQMHTDYRVSGIISKGGDAPNVIPNFTEMKYYIRAPTSQNLQEIQHRVTGCFTGAAEMTKCKVTFTELNPVYENVVTNKTLANVFLKNANDLGIAFPKDRADETKISTDAGNVSQICPTIHPLFYIGCDSDVHTKDFVHYTGKIEACEYGIIQAKAMVGTLIDVAISADILMEIKAEFVEIKSV